MEWKLLKTHWKYCKLCETYWISHFPSRCIEHNFRSSGMPFGPLAPTLDAGNLAFVHEYRLLQGLFAYSIWSVSHSQSCPGMRFINRHCFNLLNLPNFPMYVLFCLINGRVCKLHEWSLIIHAICRLYQRVISVSSISYAESCDVKAYCRL